MNKQHRYLIKGISEIASLSSSGEIIEALRVCPRPLKALLAFCFNGEPIDSSVTDIGAVEPIKPSAFTHRDGLEYGGDLLAQEALTLRKILVPAANPMLSSARRRELLVMILQRLTSEEADLLLHIIKHRTMPPQYSAIGRAEVEDSGILAATPPPNPEQARAYYEHLMSQLTWS